jgi:hypothetical protein
MLRSAIRRRTEITPAIASWGRSLPKSPLLQLMPASARKLFPGLSHLFELLAVAGWCRARHVATFGSVLQILSYFFHNEFTVATNAGRSGWFRKSADVELPPEWCVSMGTSRVRHFGGGVDA